MKTIKCIDNARIISNGQVTILKGVLATLDISVSDRIIFIVNGTEVKIVKSTIYSLAKLRKHIYGEASKTNIFT